VFATARLVFNLRSGKVGLIVVYKYFHQLNNVIVENINALILINDNKKFSVEQHLNRKFDLPKGYGPFEQRDLFRCASKTAKVVGTNGSGSLTLLRSNQLA